jgi:hypothetical protein
VELSRFLAMNQARNHQAHGEMRHEEENETTEKARGSSGERDQREDAMIEPRNAKELSDRDKLELAEFLGSADLEGAIDVTHTTARLTVDDMWALHAVDAYEKALKHPMNGQLHREDASVILGYLNQMTDERIAKEYKNRIGHRDKALADCRSVFARMLEVLVKKRNLESLVAG